MSNKAISDEKIIAALLSAGTIREAATAAGISERALYDRMHDNDFKLLYKTAKADLLRGAINSISGKLTAAADTISDIMTAQDANPATRLQAAKLLIDSISKLSGTMAEYEQAAAEQHYINTNDPFDIFA